MSEQQAEQTSGEPGSLGAGPAVPHSSDAPEPAGGGSAGMIQPSIQASASVEFPDLVPGQGAAAKVDAPKADAPRLDASKAEASKPELRPSAAHPRQGHDHVIRRPRLGRHEARSGSRNPSRTRECSASAGSPRWRPWWRWRWWQARSAARWRPRRSRVSSAMTRRAPATARSKPPLRGSTPTSLALKASVEHTLQDRR